MRPRLTIPRRVFLAFALMLSASALVAVGSFEQNRRAAATLSLVHEGYLPLALTVSEARATQSVFGNLLDRLLSERNTRSTRAWLNVARQGRPKTIDRALAGIAGIERMAPPAAQRISLAALRRELRRVKTMLAQGESRYVDLYAALDAGDKDAAERILADLRARERAIDGRLRAVWATALRGIQDSAERATAQQRRALIVLALLAIFVVVVGAAVTWWSQRVLSPLPRLQERVEAVARGDLAPRHLGPNTDDEIGRLGREFERMVSVLSARDQSLRRASENLQALQQMQAQILADLRAAVLVVDGDRVLRSQNPAAERLLSLRAADVGHPLEEVGLLGRIRGLAAAIESVVGGAPRAVLTEVALDDERYLNLVVTPFGGAKGNGARREALVVAEDVTEELRTKARLIQTERLAAIGRMAAHVTHEVRNPLSSIGLNVELLEEELEGAGNEAKELLAAIHREIERLTGVTEEYLRVARLPNPQLEPEDLTEIVRDVAGFMRRELSAAGVELEVNVPEAAPLVAVDEGQIRQVLVNLLKNARDAMSDGGRVTLSLASEQDGVVLRVRDEGSGMSADQRARIFDLFYTTKELGSGLGLPLSQQIVVAHGGLIRCQSEPGEGTTFELWFPPHQTERPRALQGVG